MNCLHVLLILNVRENDMKKSLHLRRWNGISIYDIYDIPEPISKDLDSMDLQSAWTNQCLQWAALMYGLYNEMDLW